MTYHDYNIAMSFFQTLENLKLVRSAMGLYVAYALKDRTVYEQKTG